MVRDKIPVNAGLVLVGLLITVTHHDHDAARLTAFPSSFSISITALTTAPIQVGFALHA